MIGIEQPPSDTDKGLSAYLVRMFKKVGLAIDAAWVLPPYDRKTDPSDGQLTYFSGPIPGTKIMEPGLYFYMKEGQEIVWKKVNLTDL
jgi:hypothetical protein